MPGDNEEIAFWPGLDETEIQVMSKSRAMVPTLKIQEPTKP
jgi:hypothetical protein